MHTAQISGTQSPRTTWFWQLGEANPILWTHAWKVYKALIVSRSLPREYKLQAILPALAWAGVETGEVKRKDGQYYVEAKGHEYWKAKAILKELEGVKSYDYQEDQLGAIATILAKYKRSPRSWWELKLSL